LRKKKDERRSDISETSKKGRKKDFTITRTKVAASPSGGRFLFHPVWKCQSPLKFCRKKREGVKAKRR